MKVASMLKCVKYPPVDITPETRLYIPFNEGVDPNGSISMAKDYSQYNNHATLTDVEWSPDEFNGAGKFNGSSSFGNCGNDASLNVTDAITIETWVKISDYVNYGVIIRKDATGTEGYWIRQYGTTGRTEVSFIGLTTNTVRDDNALSKNVCHHIVGKYDNIDGTITLYIDGVEVKSEPSSGSISGSDVKLTIGSTGGTSEFFNGTIDNVIISSTVRSAAQNATDCYEVVCA